MESISPAHRSALITDFSREALHLEMRDNYGGDKPWFDRWRAGDRDGVKADMQPWCDQVRAGVASGKVYRRLCVVSEPLSEYQRWSHAMNDLKVEAGEDLRWVPRRNVSAVAMPGNDFWLFDCEVVTFGLFDGEDMRTDILLSRESNVVQFCLEAFDELWSLAIPHHEYPLK
jgi:hypothetical protein